MPDPREHMDQRPWLEQILARIPGFAGYLDRARRREADALQRTFLADRLQRSKSAIDDVTRDLTARGMIDLLGEFDRLRMRLDRLIAKIRGAMNGYSGFFDLVQIDAHVLDRVYEHDADMLDRVESLAEMVEDLKQVPDPAEITGKVQGCIDQAQEVERVFDMRAEILQGLD